MLILQDLLKNLSVELWETSDLLPSGWKMQKLGDDTDCIFQSKTGTILDTFESALEDIESSKDGYTDQEIENFKKLGEQLKSLHKQNSNKYEWNESDPTVPKYWQSRVVEGKLRRHYFLSPDSSVFACRRSGPRHMIVENYPEVRVQFSKME